jgi:hypothetical protein
MNLRTIERSPQTVCKPREDEVVWCFIADAFFLNKTGVVYAIKGISSNSILPKLNLPFTDFEPLFSSYFSEYSKECNNSYSTSSSLGLLTVWAVVWLNRNWRLVLSLVRTVGIYMDTVWRNVLGGDTRKS